MITLDTELIYNTKYYELNTKRTNTNAYKSIDSYPEEYAAENTPQAPKLGNTNQDEIIKALKLYLPRNRFAILKLLNHTELVDLLFLLQKSKLVLGLKFFTKEKLLRNIYNLSKEQILKVLLQSYSKDEILSMFPIKELMAFLDSTKIQHSELMKIVQSMPRHLLAQILESVTGKPAGNQTNEQLINQIKQLKQEALVEGLKTLSYKEMLSVVNKLVQNNEELFLEFSKPALIEPITRLGKNSIVESMIALDPDTIVKMLGELPNNMLAMINTMIEPDKLADSLLKHHSDLLAALAA